MHQVPPPPTHTHRQTTTRKQDAPSSPFAFPTPKHTHSLPPAQFGQVRKAVCKCANNVTELAHPHTALRALVQRGQHSVGRSTVWEPHKRGWGTVGGCQAMRICLTSTIHPQPLAPSFYHHWLSLTARRTHLPPLDHTNKHTLRTPKRPILQSRPPPTTSHGQKQRERLTAPCTPPPPQHIHSPITPQSPPPHPCPPTGTTRAGPAMCLDSRMDPAAPLPP